MLLLIFLLSIARKLNYEKEAKLIEKIAERDDSALSELYDLYSKLIFSFTLRILKDKSEAEDIVQTVFLQIWEKASSFNNNKGSVYSWIMTLSRNKAIDKIRSKSYSNSVSNRADIDKLELKTDEYPSNLDAAILNERADILKKALNEIPEEQKSLLYLAYFEGFSQSEISEKYNIPLGTVKTRIRQAMIKLEKILKPILT